FVRSIPTRNVPWSSVAGAAGVGDPRGVSPLFFFVTRSRGAPGCWLQLLRRGRLGAIVALLRVQGFGKGLEIVRLHKNNSTTRTINIRYEKKRDGKKNRQNQKEERTLPRCIVTHQEIAENRDYDQKHPCLNRDPVSPGGLGVSLGVQYIVHAAKDESRHWRWQRSDRCGGRGPQFSLQLSSPGIDLQKLALIPSLVIENTLVEVTPQQRVQSCRIGGGQLACPEGFVPHCGGLLLF